MGVHTTADEHRDAALDKIQGSIRAISEIVINNCWGSEDYGADYRLALKKSLMELIEIRDRLG